MSADRALLDGFAGPSAPFAWRRGRPIDCATFVADVDRLSRALPDRGHVLNVCVDRYRFAVGLAAALVRGQVTLMPPTTQPGLVAQLLARFPETYCLAEDAHAAIDLTQILYDAALDTVPPATGGFVIPRIPCDRTVAYAFTSGSTGAPLPHRKTWGPLVQNVKSEADRLACGPGPEPTAIVATVPPQHMFGFESSLVMAWQCGAAIVAERPFYPADVVAALDRLPGRRVLVTTPFHLRALLAEAGTLPPVAQIVCATAPLSLDLASEAERRFGAPVVEIYGCTETGQLASRRPTDDACWHPLGDVALAIDADGRATASGGHVEHPTVLGDVLQAAHDFASSRRFSLVGRSADLVNIAGKRTSLAYLDMQLNAIDGVVDGAFFMPPDDDAERDGVTRLAAIVVAPTLDVRRLLAALRERIDPVFLPRPVHFVDRLPRNATGKLTRATLDGLIDAQRLRSGNTPGVHGSAPLP